MASLISLKNTSSVPLTVANNTWTGSIESCQTYLSIYCTVNCDTNCVLNINHTMDGYNIDYIDTFNVLANKSTNIYSVQSKSKFFNITLTNNTLVDQTYLKIVTKLVNDPHDRLQKSLGYTNTNVTNTGIVIKPSSGTIQSIMLCITSGNKNDYCYLKLYDISTIPTFSDIPILVIPIHDSSPQPIVIPLYNLLFHTGLGIRGTDLVDNTNDTTPTGNMITFISYT